MPKTKSVQMKILSLGSESYIHPNEFSQLFRIFGFASAGRLRGSRAEGLPEKVFCLMCHGASFLGRRHTRSFSKNSLCYGFISLLPLALL